MTETPAKKEILIRISGFLSEVICGRIPQPCKDAVTRYLAANRHAHDIPEWLLRRNPNYIPAEQIERLWYADHEIMRRITAPFGLDWNTHREVNDICHLTGFGSGKQGIGLFELMVTAGPKPVIEYVPFDPGPEGGDRLRDMKHIRLNGPETIAFPSLEPDQVAISTGSWGKGIMAFRVKGEQGFDETKLELRVADLTPLGIGEEHFVSGIAYEGRPLKGEIVDQGARDRYPVLWYDPQAHQWRQMYETTPSSPPA